jgi:hypothetical protein
MMTSCLAANERSRRFWSPLITTAAMSMAMAFAPNMAHADEATAEALFKAGKALMDQKKYAEACPKFEASYKVDPGIGTILNLADCYEKDGKLALAWGKWGEARDQAKRENDKARMDLAARRQNELDPKVPKLTVNVTGPTTGIDIYRDELQLDTAMLGVPLPVDPGAHIVTLRRGKSVLREKKVAVEEKSTGEVTIDATGIPAAPVEPPKDSSNPTKEGTPVRQNPTQPPTEMVFKSKSMIAGGVVLNIVGLPTGIIGVGLTVVGLLPGEGGAGFIGGGLLVLAAGAGMMTGGIMLIANGTTRVPKPKTGLQMERPSVFIGPGSIGIRGTF